MPISHRLLRWSAGALIAALAAPTLAQPANDSCANPPPFKLGSTVKGTTIGAEADVQVSCQQDAVGDVWYTFSPQAFRSYRFHVTGTDNSALSIAIVSGCGFPFGEYMCAANDSNGPELEVLLIAGDFVHIRVASTVPQNFTLTGDATPPSANDECTGATPIFLGVPISTNNFSATNSLAFDDAQMCASIQPGLSGGADVFFAFTPDFDGYYDISNCNSDLDSVISVHSACPATAANAIACNDNAAISRCPSSFGTMASYVNGVQMTAGVTYYIRVGGVRLLDLNGKPVEPSRGSFELVVTQGVAPNIPANDDCDTAEVVFADAGISGSTINTNVSEPSECGFDDVFDVWYEFTSPASDRRAFAPYVFMGSFANAASISVHDGCTGEVLVCYASNPFVNPEMIAWVVLDPGQTVKIRVAGHNAAQDDFTFIVLTGEAGAPNDTCETAQALDADEPVIADTNGANTADPTECGYSDFNPLWYSFTAPTSGYYRFATDFFADPKSFDTSVLVVYGECGGEPLACATSGDSFSTNPAAAALALYLEAGQTRLVRVSYHYPRRAPMTVTVSGPLPQPPAVPNDLCPDATVITSMPFTAEVNVTRATPDVELCAFDGDPTAPSPAGVWYRYTPDVNRVFHADVSAGNRFGARTTIFTGACGSLTQIGCHSPFPDLTGTPLTAGVTYHILVSLVDFNGGIIDEIPYATTYDINFIALTPPANDDCATAQRITSSSTSLTVNTLPADADAPEPSCIGSGGVLNNAVWYVLTPSTSGTLHVNGIAPNFGGYSPGGALFSGSCDNLTEVACDTPVDGWLITNEFDFNVELAAGQTYYLVVGAWGAPAGDVTDLTIEFTGKLGCEADFNADGAVNSQDFFDFLNAFFANSPAADFNDDDLVNSQDFFDFLNVFFVPCN